MIDAKTSGIPGQAAVPGWDRRPETAKRMGKHVQANNYWSGSTNANNTNNAWNVNMNDGNVNNNNKNNNNYVWPVRSGEWTSCAPEAFRRELFTDLHASWRRCRRMKRNTVNALRFEYKAELNLLQLADELSCGTYRPARAIRFAVERPKLREIVAADFRDRVVHHYLVEKLEQIYEPVFIHDSYACRKGKGVHKAITRVRKFIRTGSVNGRYRLYALHLDVRSFFTTIDRRLLAQIIENRLVREARNPGNQRSAGIRHLLPFLNRLTRTILDYNPMEYRIDRGDHRLLARVPSHKSLLHAPQGVGLPVGNLTSQFFANVYLNELDQFCKHTLACRHYIRYCDDFLILDRSPERLAELREAVRVFIADTLRLTLNERYATIAPVTNGIDFLGYIIYPDHLLVRRRSINNLRTRLDAFRHDHIRQHDDGLLAIPHNTPAAKKLQGVMASYFGHFKWADTIRLRRSIFDKRYPWLNALFRLDRDSMPRYKGKHRFCLKQHAV